jgi:hypothetical protein
MEFGVLFNGMLMPILDIGGGALLRFILFGDA